MKLYFNFFYIVFITLFSMYLHELKATTLNVYINAKQYQLPYLERDTIKDICCDSLKNEVSKTKILLLDSVVSTNSDGIFFNKYQYAYNINGNCISEDSYNWVERLDDWKINLRIEYKYDNVGNLISKSQFIWDDKKKGFLSQDKYVNFYKNNLVESHIDYDWIETKNIWKEKSTHKFSYDTNGNMMLDVYYIWDNINNIWKKVNKHKNVYNEKLKQILSTDFSWDEIKNNWKICSKIEYNYDINGNEAYNMFYVWNLNTNNWELNFKTKNIYDNNKNLFLQIGYKWGYSNKIWYPYWRMEYKYYPNNKLYQMCCYNFVKTDWVISYCHTYYYSIH